MKTPYRFVALLATVALAVGATTAFAHDGGGHPGKRGGDRHGGAILRSGLVGSTPQPAGPVLFGVPPGGAAWTIASSDARVRADRVRVRGERLLLANGTTGPVQMVAAAVFCNDSTKPAFTSAPVPLDPDGDFRVDQDVTTPPLPSPCLAPAVLVRIAQANGAPVTDGPYIAATGGNAPAAPATGDDH